MGINCFINRKLEALYNGSPIRLYAKDCRLVILSDMHLGNGGRADEFKRNSSLVLSALEQHYLPAGYTLVLNGDIEELQKFSFKNIRACWGEFYRILEKYDFEERLFRLAGNHDHTIKNHNSSVLPGLRLFIGDIPLFILHGHQASGFRDIFNTWVGFVLKWIAAPLGLKNYSVSHSSRKKFKIERRVYSFSNRQKIISVIGHTHRPLFESLSRFDTLRYKIELKIRKLNETEDREERSRLEERIGFLKQELYRTISKRKRAVKKGDSLYNEFVVVPSLFNSGCCIGKRGFTCLEIESGIIRLVHWSDPKRNKFNPEENGYPPETLGPSGFIRRIIKEDSLAYVHSRIRLLT